MNIVSGLQQSMAAGDRVFELMDTPSEESGEELFTFDEGRIEFKDVSFEYTAGVPVLETLEFHGRTWTDSCFCRSYWFREIFHYELTVSLLRPNEWCYLHRWKTHVTLTDVVFEARWESFFKIRTSLQEQLLLMLDSIMNRFSLRRFKRRSLKVGGGHLLTKSEKDWTMK